MVNLKKILNKRSVLVFGIIFLFVVGGIFYWQNNQKDVRELNKNLPTGVKVTKNLFGFGNEYKVINKIDGYDFKVPSTWKGVREISYIAEREEKGYKGTSINIIGSEGRATGIGIDKFETEEKIILENWAKNMFNTVGLTGEFISDKIDNSEVLKTQENTHLLGMYMYFIKKDASIYTFTGSSEEFIHEIISNGKW